MRWYDSARPDSPAVRTGFPDSRIVEAVSIVVCKLRCQLQSAFSQDARPRQKLQILTAGASAIIKDKGEFAVCYGFPDELAGGRPGYFVSGAGAADRAESESGRVVLDRL